MKSKILTVLVVAILLTAAASVLPGQSVEAQQLIKSYTNHFSELCGSIFLLLLFLFILLFFWLKKSEFNVSGYTPVVYLLLLLFIVLSLVGLWGTLIWAWDLPSQYFNEFYWTNMKLAAVGGIILSLIAFFPLFSRESIIYTIYLFATKKQKSWLPKPASLRFFIPWTGLKLLFGMWLFSNMLVGLWIVGGNGLILFSRDSTSLYAQLLIIGPSIAGAIGIRIFIYCLHQLMGVVQYLAESLKRILTNDEYETIWGKVMKIFGVILIFWSMSSLFGITGQYEHLVGPYRHDLFSYTVKFGAGIGCMLVGGFLIGDTKREKIVHIASAFVFTGVMTALTVYYSPDTRVTTGFFIGVVLFPVLYYVFWRELMKGTKLATLPIKSEAVRLTGVSTLAAITAIFIILLVGTIGSSIWLKPQHRKDPLSINADLIDLELELNALSAGLDFDEIYWEFPFETEVDSLEDVESLIGENEETFRIIRLWDAPHTAIRFKPSVGLRWMEMGDTDIVRFTVDGELRQFWISPKNLNLEEILEGSENAWYNEHKVYTHSVGYIVADALTGKFESRKWMNNNIYFGEGFYRDFIYDFRTRELQGEYTGPIVYPRVPLRSVFTKELTFYTGETVAYMNIFERAAELFPWMYIDPDPYLCVADDEVWYSMDLGAYITPTKIPLVKAPYVRPLLKLLINTETGEFNVYYDDTSDDTVLLPLVLSVYGDKITPLSQAPDWYIQQLRYPEVFMEIQVVAMNVYHVQSSAYDDKTRASVYVHEEDFFEISSGEDLRHVLQTFFGKTEFVSMITVEFSGKKVPNIAAIWVTQNDYPNYGKTHLIRVPSEADEELRVIGTSVVPNALTADEEVSYWLRTHEDADTGNIILYRMEDRVYYFIPFYTGREKTVTLQQVACVMGITGNEAESRKVGFGDDVVTAFRNVQLEIIASKVSGRDIGTYSEAMNVLAGETVEGENVSEIVSQMNWLLEQREAALAEGDEVGAAQLLEEFFELFKKLAELLED